MYKQKLEDMTNGPQFERITATRKNGKHIILKEEERINSAIKSLEKAGKINETFASYLTSKGAKPARLYGLAKIHKENIPLRPVVSMSGCSYYNIGKKWLVGWKQ